MSVHAKLVSNTKGLQEIPVKQVWWTEPLLTWGFISFVKVTWPYRDHLSNAYEICLGCKGECERIIFCLIWQKKKNELNDVELLVNAILTALAKLFLF